VIALIGASGRSGAALARALRQPFRAVVRDAAKWGALGISAEMRVADLADAADLRAALTGASLVVSCAHARHAPALLAATEAPLVLMGSTRRYSRWPDAHGDGVQLGEAALMAAGRPGMILHPTMIYGAQGEDNVQRLAGLMRHLPVLPLPGGGRSLVQPIHQDDVTRCLLAAIELSHDIPRAITIAGPDALAYRDFCGAIARAAGLRPRPVVPVPSGVLMALAPLARPRIAAEEVRRLTEDKAFDIGPMRETLGVAPMPLAEGLRLTFA
jgi:nucleoside-diphosphate-sugar epimerase